MADHLFVYGTLLKGEIGNSLLQSCILTDYTSIPGTLFDTGHGFPAASLEISDNSVIYGELYRLPHGNDEVINELDLYENISNGLFKRTGININGTDCFIYVLNDPHIFNSENKITSGSWLRFAKNIKEDPVSFVLKFEKNHKFSYRHITGDKTLFLPGNNGIIVTAPHATNHIRMKKFKVFERYTGALSVLLHSLTGSASLYTNSVSISDPNYYDDCDFKEKLGVICKENRRYFLLDIHGTGEEREYDIYPGVGKDKEFLLGHNEYLEDLFITARKYSISCGSLDKFPASKQQTVTKYAATRLGVPSMQLEINRKYRLPENNPEKFLLLVEFLREFLGKIKKRNE